MPATAADNQVLIEPHIKAEIANCDISSNRLGAKAPMTPTCIPTLPKFANPQSAYVETSSDLSVSCPLYSFVSCWNAMNSLDHILVAISLPTNTKSLLSAPINQAIYNILFKKKRRTISMLEKKNLQVRKYIQ